MGLFSALWRMPSRVLSGPTRLAEGLSTAGRGSYLGKFNKYGEIGVDTKATDYAKANPNDFWWYDIKKNDKGEDIMKPSWVQSKLLGLSNGLRGFNHAFRGKSPMPKDSINKNYGLFSKTKDFLVDSAKDTTAAITTFGLLDTAADAIAPASGYYINMPYTDPTTGEQKTIKLHADSSTINPYVKVKDPETGEEVDVKSKIDGRLERANPYATMFSNFLRLGSSKLFKFTNRGVVTELLPAFTSAGQNGLETNSPLSTAISSVVAPSAETAKLYAENVKDKMHELYSTKTPSQIRALMSDKAALTNYLTEGVKLPKRAPVLGVISGWADRYTADKFKSELRNILDKNLPDNMGTYLSAAQVAGGIPGIGDYVNEEVRKAMDAAIGDIDKKIGDTYMSTLNNPWIRFTGLSGRDMANYINLGLINGDSRVQARRNRNNQAGQN